MGTIITKLCLGEVQLSNIKTQLNVRINQLYNEARQAFEEALDLYY